MKIISGGQTGADRAALDFAIKHNIPYGGWIPKGRKAEDGRLPDHYQLREMPSSVYSKRTEKNILDSDGTLIISHGQLTGGSALTREFSKRQKRPCIHIDMEDTAMDDAATQVKAWIKRKHIQVLNVAGSKDSKDPEIYDATMSLLKSVWFSE
jgi:hypothetical protein